LTSLNISIILELWNLRPPSPVSRLSLRTRASPSSGPEGLCVGDIAAKFDIAPATLSFHLKELTNAGLLVSRQEGRFIYYAPDFEKMNALVSYLMENCCGGETCAPARKPVTRKRKEKVT